MCLYTDFKTIQSTHSKIEREIQQNTIHYIQVFLKNDPKYKGTPVPTILHPKDVRTGFNIDEVNVVDEVHVLYNDAQVGDKFSTPFFKKLKCIEGKDSPSFAMKLQASKATTKIRKIKVEFVDNKNELSTVSPLDFACWFAYKLARKYLSWCKEQAAQQKKKAIALCIGNKRPYSTCLATATLQNSANGKRSKRTPTNQL